MREVHSLSIGNEHVRRIIKLLVK